MNMKLLAIAHAPAIQPKRASKDWEGCSANKNQNFKIPVKDIDFFVVSLRIFVWFLRGTVRSDG